LKLPTFPCSVVFWIVAILAPLHGGSAAWSQSDDLLLLDNETIKVGIDRTKGASITWLSWKNHPKNAVNIHDPGRLIQQSFYAGASLDRTSQGQSKAWSPWPWNPIQGGGVGSWARVSVFEQTQTHLHAETIPKLWDMPDEEADAVMRQWTSFERGMPNVVVVKCEFVSQRMNDDRWGPGVPRHQELPACYFTRHFDNAKSYLGNGLWRTEVATPGPPWHRAAPPQHAMAFFEAGGEGIGIYSPASDQAWNFGPHGNGNSDDPRAGPCVHVAPIGMSTLEPRVTYRFRYWMILGTEKQIASRLDQLTMLYSNDKSFLSETVD
jgi:hypothetical protein